MRHALNALARGAAVRGICIHAGIAGFFQWPHAIFLAEQHNRQQFFVGHIPQQRSDDTRHCRLGSTCNTRRRQLAR